MIVFAILAALAVVGVLTALVIKGVCVYQEYRDILKATEWD